MAGCGSTMAKLPLTGSRRKSYVRLFPFWVTDRMYSLVGLCSMNRVRRSMRELRMDVCQCFETARQWVRSLIERCDRIISRSSVYLGVGEGF
jgi:hypothetical protein